MAVHLRDAPPGGGEQKMDNEDYEDADGRSEGLGIIVWLSMAMLLARLMFMVNEALCDSRREAPECQPCVGDSGDGGGVGGMGEMGEMGGGRELAVTLEASLVDANGPPKKEL